jgi:hypothetical protein
MTNLHRDNLFGKISFVLAINALFLLPTAQATEAPQQLAFNKMSFNSVEGIVIELENALLQAAYETVPEETAQGAEASADELAEVSEIHIAKEDSYCVVHELGIRFACDHTWSKNSAGEASSLILSKDPLVTLTWGKLNGNIHFLGQLSKFFFEELGRYRTGFVTENVHFAGYNAVAVKGYDIHQPDTQRRDYFYLYDNQLVNVSFTLADNDKLNEGKFLVKEVASTFSPIE